MKKILVILAVVVAVIGASVWFVISRYGIIDPAEVVPADAVAFIALPDVVQTGLRWNQTALAKIAAEPSVAEFFAKPVQSLGPAGGDEAVGILTRLKPGRFFLAVNSISQNNADVVAGFQYFGTRKDFDEAVGRLHAEVTKLMPDAVRSEVAHGGDTIVQHTGSTTSLFTASHGSWGFVSNSLTAIQASLDRASGRASTPSLAASPEFKSLRSKLSKQAEILWFMKTKPILDLLLAAGAEQGAEVNLSQLEQLRQMPAIGGSLAFDGADQLERIFVLWTDAPAYPSINKSGLAFSNPDNILFMQSVQDWSQIATDEYRAALPPEIISALEENQIDLKALPAMFGDNATLVASWSNNAMIPGATAALAVKDRAAIEGIARRLIEKYLPNATVSTRGGATVFEFPVAGLALIDPTVGISDDYLIGSLTSAGLDAALIRNPAQPTLESAPAFQSVSSEWKDGLQSFLFIDARTIFERVYNAVRPMIIFGAAMAPGVAQAIDVEKLPETEAIAKHLNPIVMTQRMDADGILIESRGPITLYQSFLILGIGVGGAAAAQGLLQGTP